MTNDRREFLRHLALGAAAAGTGAIGATPSSVDAQQGAPPSKQVAPSQGSVRPVSPRTLDGALFKAVGDAVLPESLGVTARAAAVREFATWIARYEPVTEEMHGYGYAELTFTPSDPSPGWNAQLEGLDLLSRRRHRRGFALLGVVRRRELLAEQIGRGQGSRLPSNPLEAPHVAVALLAHWAASVAATDLAYGAQIGKGSCRPLALTERPPLPLAPPESR